MTFSNSIPDNMLFYILNGGFQFITLKNCEIKERKNLTFRPDKAAQLHVNISSIVSIQIVEILPEDYEYEAEIYEEEINSKNSTTEIKEKNKPVRRR